MSWLDWSDRDANCAAYAAFQRDLAAIESWRDRDESEDYSDDADDDLPSDEELADIFADDDEDDAEGEA